jgi:hypothetical protein
MNKLIYLTSLLCIFTVNIFSQSVNDAITAMHYQTENFDIAIFPANSPDLLPGAERFTPTKPEIDKAEEALLKQLKDLNADKQNQYETPVIDKNLKKYKRQYFGYIDSKGNKILFINCFWKREKDPLQNWMKEMVRVLDGGSYYWNVKFNLNTNELTDLVVNGQS